MENLNWIFRFGLRASVLLAVSGCAKSFPNQISTPQNKGVAVGANEFISGAVRSTESQSVDLRSYSTQPLVVVFAQDTCTVCRAETAEFRGTLTDPSHDPQKVKLVTVLVGAVADDATDWKSANSVPWTVAIDPGDPLFRRYCGGGKVPCTVVQLPGQGIVFKKVGASAATEIRNLTGDWER